MTDPMALLLSVWRSATPVFKQLVSIKLMELDRLSNVF